jgi:uncharacterized protein YkwD
MKHPLLHQLATIIFAAGVFFCAAPVAFANTLSLSQQYSYPGLTFSSPLTFTQPVSLTGSTTNIYFTAQNTLLISKNDNRKPLESIVLTPTIMPTATPTPQPTANPTPTPTSQPAITAADTQISPTYVPTSQSNPGGLNADDLFSMVNAYRASQGLPAFQEDAKTCSLAEERAPEVAGEVASGNLHAGLIAMNLPYWNTENIIQMNSDQAAFNWWINDPIHHEAIVGNFTYSCVACSGNSCAEEFTNYEEK